MIIQKDKFKNIFSGLTIAYGQYQPRLIKIKTMKQVEASTTQETYQEEHF